MDDQPLDFSVKSPSSPGGDSSNTSKTNLNGSTTKDDQYWTMSERHNATVRKSRYAKRQKVIQTIHENQTLREENEKLKAIVRTLEEHVCVCTRGDKTVL